MLLLEKHERESLWKQVTGIVEGYLEELPRLRVTPQISVAEARSLFASITFDQPLSLQAAVNFAAEGLTRYGIQTPHPRYYGLFNPAGTTMGVAAETLAAAFNPQTGAWGHHPFGVELERHLIRAFAAKFGYEPSSADGIFTVGGSEANHTALLTALTYAFPSFHQSGVRGLAAQPVLYASAESHHSLLKAARLCGLGAEALRAIPVGEDLRMKADALASAIREDRRAGHLPFLVVATAGTTNAGVIDPLSELAGIAARENVWFHVDAAWGGAAALVPELWPLLAGIERADSIAFDTHKWLSIPLTAGLYLTRHTDILDRTFRVEPAYVPRDGAAEGVVDTYKHSMQWGRHFLGLKVFLSLAVAGWEGYADTLRHMTAMGDLLREELQRAGWIILNKTSLPLVCFVDASHADGRTSTYLEAIAREVVSSGDAWISTTRLGAGIPALRACITSFRTEPRDIQILVEALDRARASQTDSTPAKSAPGRGR